ncbi:AAA family ATPase [Mycobacteroides franklinii]|uniref:AAA family ATPase n=1 Tax=Mycobacteroides franklinii TaxID=948102 RepID=UPI000AB3A162|nr:AAA family ATPase [Mycobacteroides franklinii]
MPKTQLKKLVIDKFRALINVEVEFGDRITVVCGKNGTSKSSILGIAAQIFSFDRDYVKNEVLAFEQITGGPFKSQYSEHFRISETFDFPGSMTVGIELYDGYTEQAATARLELMKRQSKQGNTLPRPVVRNNSTAFGKDNASRNFTHPVIFLSLKRLYPIAARDYAIGDFGYLNQYKQDFISLTNEILNRNSAYATGTDGTISSAVAHGENYDQESVSAGEDNTGQIILALMSFKKLKEEYSDYKGGLLLIDEADAALFPTAQINLLKMLDRECRNLNIQVVMTSHSPVMIEYAFEQSKKFGRSYKTIYLSNTYGDVQVMQDWSWSQISADINTKTIDTVSGTSLPRINVYFEDKEAADFFAALMIRQPLKKFTAPLPEITLGCSNYLQLIQKKIPEFAERSVVCLDADQESAVGGKNYKTVVLLPGLLPPDQLIFEHLYNLTPDNEFWKNDLQFTRDVFTNAARELLNEFQISGSSVDVKKRLDAYCGEKKPREVFKRFYKSDEIQQLVSAGAKPYNPWRHWTDSNPVSTNEFLNSFKIAIRGVMRNAYAVDAVKFSGLVEVTPRKI